MKMGASIAGRFVGEALPPFIVAELSANHGGSLERALAAMEAAKAADADAVKLQTYTADTMTIDNDGPDFRIKGGFGRAGACTSFIRKRTRPGIGTRRYSPKAAN